MCPRLSKDLFVSSFYLILVCLRTATAAAQKRCVLGFSCAETMDLFLFIDISAYSDVKKSTYRDVLFKILLQ